MVIFDSLILPVFSVVYYNQCLAGFISTSDQVTI
jgi:hypothetical protein